MRSCTFDELLAVD